MLLRAIIADSRLYLRVRPNATQITVNYSATSDTEVLLKVFEAKGQSGADAPAVISRVRCCMLNAVCVDVTRQLMKFNAISERLCGPGY